MKLKDISDYLRLRRAIHNPWAFVWSRKHPPKTQLLEVRFRDGRTFSMRSGSADRNIFHGLYLKDEYDIRDVYDGNLDCVIDIGGHIGAFSFLVAPFARRVLVFEPMPENFKLLQKNLSAPQFGHVSCINAAVTDRKSDVKIYESHLGSGHHSAFRRSREETKAETVPGLSLEDIFRDYDVLHCDLLKLDCEGAEYPILFSASDDVISRVSRVVLEYHDVPGADPSWNAESLQNHLEAKGFKVRRKPIKRHPKEGFMHCRR